MIFENFHIISLNSMSLIRFKFALKKFNSIQFKLIWIEFWIEFNVRNLNSIQFISMSKFMFNVRFIHIMRNIIFQRLNWIKLDSIHNELSLNWVSNWIKMISRNSTHCEFNSIQFEKNSKIRENVKIIIMNIRSKVNWHKIDIIYWCFDNQITTTYIFIDWKIWIN